MQTIFTILFFITTVIAFIFISYQNSKIESLRYIITGLDNRINEIPIEIKKAREDALSKQRTVIKGQIGEQMIPWLKGFPYSPSDLKFFGNAFDYVAIVNMAAARDSEEEVKEIVFLDIKVGQAQLSTIQRKIRDAILEGKIYWETMRVNDDNSVTIKRATKKEL